MNGIVSEGKPARISGGVSFDPAELDTALAIASRKAAGLKPKNGRSVVSGKDRDLALKTVSQLCRDVRKLGIFDEYSNQLSEMIRRIKSLK